jgi:hypothetical protein
MSQLIAKSKLLVLDLFAGIWQHNMVSAKTLGQLNSENFKVQYLSCGQLFVNYCNVQESKGRNFPSTPLIRTLDCKDCMFSARLSSSFLKQRGVGFNSTDFLSEYSNEALRHKVNVIKSNILTAPVSLDFHVDGVPVVRYAMYETLIKYKKINFELSDIEKEYFETNLENCILTVLAGQKYLDENHDFSAIVIPSPEYGPNNSFASLALQRGIPVYSIRGSSNLAEMGSSAMIWRWDIQPELPPHLSSWQGWRNVEISANDRRRIEKHKQELLSGKSPFVYSSPFTDRGTPEALKNRLGVKNDSTVILMSLSSTDEIIASKTIQRGVAVAYPGQVFADQFEWVMQTLDWIKDRPSLTLIVRLHPRDLPNKRESVLSEQHERWVNLLSEVPPNVIINHPEQEISFQDVCAASNVLVTGWSSTAIEAMLLNKPVVTYDRSLPGFPEDIHLTGNSRNAYFTNLETAITIGVLSNGKEVADRWLTHFLIHGSIQLTGGILSTMRRQGPVIVRKLFSGLDRYFSYLWRPLELWSTFRKSKDAVRVNKLFTGLRANLYEK